MKATMTSTLTLHDPVCGRAVTSASTHRAVHGAGLFFFCSEACCARFSVEPARFIETPAGASAHAGESAQLASIEAHGIPNARSAVSSCAANAAIRAAKLAQRVPSGLRGLIYTWLLSWRAAHRAGRTTRELLALYRAVAAELAGRSDHEVYREMVRRRAGCDAVTAETMLENASESFAEWPVRRELTLCDVVHYLTISEFVSAHDDDLWSRQDVRHIVNANIPHDLCIVHKAR
ncbi:MAG: YHS domain-containing protein [Pseudomonadota bacterium]|nr:YHS domain-containing protein [Pseudomonadota bacterium]